MYYYPKQRQWPLLSGIQVYNRPQLLAGALQQLECFTGAARSLSETIRRAAPGSVIDLLDLADMSRASFELVMPNQADVEKNRISVHSPLGASLLGLTVGDVGRIVRWGRSGKFQVLAVRHGKPVTTQKEESSP